MKLKKRVDQKWYEDIPKHGVLCWENKHKDEVCIIKHYLDDQLCPFVNGNISHSTAIPLTRDEIKAFMVSA